MRLSISKNYWLALVFLLASGVTLCAPESRHASVFMAGFDHPMVGFDHL